MKYDWSFLNCGDNDPFQQSGHNVNNSDGFGGGNQGSGGGNNNPSTNFMRIENIIEMDSDKLADHLELHKNKTLYHSKIRLTPLSIQSANTKEISKIYIYIEDSHRFLFPSGLFTKIDSDLITSVRNLKENVPANWEGFRKLNIQ